MRVDWMANKGHVLHLRMHSFCCPSGIDDRSYQYSVGVA
jgi:hypothetical protein